MNRSVNPVLNSRRGLLFLRLMLLSLVASLGLVTLVLMTRRLLAAIITPLPFWPALLTGLCLAVGSWLLRRSVERLFDSTVRERLLAVCTAITWLIVLSLTFANANPLATIALWLTVIATESAWHVLPRRAGTPAASPVPMSAPSVNAAAVLNSESGSASDSASVDGTGLLQQLVRTRDGQSDRIIGHVRIDFAPSEQTAAAHIVFQPPLAGEPHVNVDAVNGSDVIVRATECRSYGVRLEAKRRQELLASSSVLARIEVVSSRRIVEAHL